MTNADGSRPDPDARDGGPPDDGPTIDPRDPLGLGDLHLEDWGDRGAAGTDPSPAAPDDRRASEVEASEGEDVLTDDAPLTAGAGPAAGLQDTLEAEGPDPAAPQGAPERQETPPTSGTPAAADDAARPQRSGWARLGHAMRPRTTPGQLMAAGLCALLGFALVAQVQQTTDTQLGALRQNDLVRLLDETTTRTGELEQESLDLQRERDELLSGSDRQQAALDAARRTAAMQGILTGRLPATGPGVRITLTEPEGEIRPATMLHVLEELRNAGAEAMELNGQRITASSAFTGTRGEVVLDGKQLESPFRWSVIGNPDTIAPALEIPGGALVRVRADGGRGAVEKSDRVDVTALRELPDPVYATPVEDED